MRDKPEILARSDESGVYQLPIDRSAQGSPLSRRSNTSETRGKPATPHAPLMHGNKYALEDLRISTKISNA